MKFAGEFARGLILYAAEILREDWAPGIVAILLLVALIIVLLAFWREIRRRREALRWLRNMITAIRGKEAMAQRIDEISANIEREKTNSARQSVAEAWKEYRATLVIEETEHGYNLRNAVRPGTFFNLEDLHFNTGFFRILPGLFITVGLFLTFLGLISALASMVESVDGGAAMDGGTMATLLNVASAKFIMSLVGLLCSIVFTIALRHGMGQIEGAVHRVNRAIEERLSYISLEEIALAQIRATREQQEHFRKIAFEMVAEFGRPLHEELLSQRENLPKTISTSISDAMSPLLKQVGQMSSDGVGDMVRDLSSRFSDDVGKALADASNRLSEAGERIETLVARMDESSGKMGGQMEGAIERLGQSMQDLQKTLLSGAESASGTFNAGAEQMLAAMNETLQGIRDNTSDGARAMSAAAEDMRKAAEGMRSELETAAREGSEAARTRMEAAGADVSGVIDKAGAGVLEAFSRSSERIAQLTREMTDQSAEKLLGPINQIADGFDAMVEALADSAKQVRDAGQGMRASAEASQSAAGAFRASAESLSGAAEPIRATIGQINDNTRSLNDSTRRIADGAQASAKAASEALATAQEILGGEQKAIAATLEQLTQALERMRGQGDRLDQMDEKLGAAFERFSKEVETGVDSLHGHVRELQDKLNPALDTLREVVEQAEKFSPQSRGQ